MQHLLLRKFEYILHIFFSDNCLKTFLLVLPKARITFFKINKFKYLSSISV